MLFFGNHAGKTIN